VHREPERAGALEDAAALLAAAGRAGEAAATLAEAVRIYERLGARWDITRAAGRATP
jgi:hypothetical protein